MKNDRCSRERNACLPERDCLNTFARGLNSPITFRFAINRLFAPRPLICAIHRNNIVHLDTDGFIGAVTSHVYKSKLRHRRTIGNSRISRRSRSMDSYTSRLTLSVFASKSSRCYVKSSLRIVKLTAYGKMKVVKNVTKCKQRAKMNQFHSNIFEEVRLSCCNFLL